MHLSPISYVHWPSMAGALGFATSVTQRFRTMLGLPNHWEGAEQMLILGESTAGWVLGISIGVVVVAVVVVLVLMLIVFASRVHAEAQEAVTGLDRVRGATNPLWAVDQVNAAAVGILKGARSARKALG